MLGTSLLASLFVFGASAAAPAPAAAVTATWYSAETYYLYLLNCTRTGGWVQKDGSCTGYGSGRYSSYVKPLSRTAGLSDVARSWARVIARDGTCRHGDPGARLRAAGFRGSWWGENIGCYDLTSKASVLASHLAFQREKSTNGGHWQNIKNPHYTRVGIGVYKANGHTRLVVDFWTP